MKKLRTRSFSFILLLLSSTVLIQACREDSTETVKFYVGSGGKQQHSIYMVALDPATETFTLLDSFAGAPGASYLAPSPYFDLLYALDRTQNNKEHNSLSAFKRDQATGKLEFLNRQSSEGRGICHLSVSQDGSWLFGANYSSGHASALPIQKDGKLAPALAVAKGEGSGPVSSRQQSPHAHQVILDPGQNFLLVPDLGCDRVFIYLFDAETGSLTANLEMTAFKLVPGAGPRHLVFDQSGLHTYILNELNATVTVCLWDGENGVLKELQTISTVDDDYQGHAQPAAIRMHPNGRFVYASTRGENSCITSFAINPDGLLERIQVMEGVPYWPRDFELSPDGKWMIVAGRRANEIRLYQVDPESGLLSATESRLELADPSNILFFPKKTQR